MSSTSSNRARRVGLALGVAALAVAVVAPVAGAAGPRTRLVSVDSAGNEKTGDSVDPSLSHNGRYVAFASDAALAGSNSLGHRDVFVHDRKKKKTRLISKKLGGGQADESSSRPSISASGRFIAFDSRASDLVGSDGNAMPDIYLYDRDKKKMRRVTRGIGGSEANGLSSRPSISADGRFIAYQTTASNLIGFGKDTNGVNDVYVYDRKKRKHTRVSVTSTGQQISVQSKDPAISANGRYVVFASGAKDLAGTETDTDSDIFIHDRKTKKTRRVTKAKGGGFADGSSHDPDVSADGNLVSFDSGASNLVGNDSNSRQDSFVYNRAKKQTKRVTIPNGGGQSNAYSEYSEMSANGRVVAWVTPAKDLGPKDTNDENDIYYRDRKRGKTKRASVKAAGGSDDGSADTPVMSGDGRFVAFQSTAALQSKDGNGSWDIYIRGPLY